MARAWPARSEAAQRKRLQAPNAVAGATDGVEQQVAQPLPLELQLPEDVEHLAAGRRRPGRAGRTPRPREFADDEAVTALQEARQLVEASALLGGLPGGGGLDELVDVDVVRSTDRFRWTTWRSPYTGCYNTVGMTSGTKWVVGNSAAVALLTTFTIACGDEPRTPAGPTPTVPPVTVEESGFTLSGTVSDGRMNGPVLAGATVRVTPPGTAATTGPDGRYEVRNLSGAVTVGVGATHYNVPETVEVTMDEDRTLDFVLEHTGNPPYQGTVFITPDIITPSDPSSLRSAIFTGRRTREFWDRPAERWTSVDVYLFNAQYGGVEVEFQIHPEFGSREAAEAEVEDYATPLGQLPSMLLSGVKEVEISASNNLWQGNDVLGIIHIYTGFSEEAAGFWEEILVHEGGHTSLDAVHKGAAGWLAAQEADSVFISEYARENPDREDVAESISAWFAVRYQSERLSESDRAAILTAIPNRLLYFDEQGFDMSPYQRSTRSAAPVLGERWLQPRIWFPFEGPPIR